MTSNAPPPVKNSHYISRFALRNWAQPKTGKVTVFNFSTGTFEPESTKRTYIADEAFPGEVEKWLKDNIEDVLGEYIARCKRTKPPEGQKYELPHPTEREWRALLLWVITQPLRTALARDSLDTALPDLVRKSDAFINQLLAAHHQIAQSYVVFAARETLYFPETGIVGLPLLGGLAFAFFVPIHPRIFAAIVPRAAGDGHVEELLKKLGLATALSAGLQGDLMVIPPVADEADPKVVESHLRLARDSARRFTQILLHQQSLVGMKLGDEWLPPPVRESPEAMIEESLTPEVP